MAGFFERLKEGLKKTRDSIADGLDSVFGDYSEVDEDFFEVACPNCGEEVFFDEDILDEGCVRCPNCGENLEFDLTDLSEEDEDGEDEEEEDPRDELVKRLILYRHFKYMASELYVMEDEAARFIYRETEDIPKEVSDYVPPVDLDELLMDLDGERLRKLFLEVMRRREYRRDERRESFGVIRRERMPIGARISSLIAYARKNRHFSFRSLFRPSATRQEVVVTFLAVLELMKVGAVKVEQPELCGDMELRTSGDIDESSINMEELLDE